MSLWIRKLTKGFGTILAVISLSFVIYQIKQYESRIDLFHFSLNKWLVVVILTSIIGLANYLLASAWRRIIDILGFSVSMKWAYWAYGVSQLAKYVPGNIFQFAGRQAIGVAAGLPNWLLIKSIFWEVGLIAFQGVIFAILIMPMFIRELDLEISYNLASLVFVLVLFLVTVLSGRWKGISLRKAMLCYAVFLTITGIMFLCILLILTSKHDQIMLATPLIIGAYVVSWLIGLITPGAPAGVGVREVVLYGLLYSVVEVPTLLNAILLARLVTVAGDLIYFLVAVLVGKMYRLDSVRISPNKLDRYGLPP
jgi:hypothetical protein